MQEEEGDADNPMYGKKTSNRNKTTFSIMTQKMCNNYKKHITKDNILIRHQHIKYFFQKNE